MRRRLVFLSPAERELIVALRDAPPEWLVEMGMAVVSEGSSDGAWGDAIYFTLKQLKEERKACREGSKTT